MENHDRLHPCNKITIMANIKSISIPQPCHQSWQQMAPITAGRHCENCCKTVTDFTTMSNDEIITYLNLNSNTCGRFEKQQLSSINNQLYIEDMPRKGGLKGWVMALGLLWSTASFKATAQTGAPMAQTTADSSQVKHIKPIIIGKVAMPQYRKICGQVMDSFDNSPIPGVTISTNSNRGTITDVKGNFKLSVPASDTAFTARFIGYNTQLIKIDLSKMEYNVNIRESEAVLGGIVYIRPPFFKRVYYRFIKNPVRKLFKAI
jgi:hypothetical protein